MRLLLHRAHSTNIEIHIHNIFTWVNQRVANFVYSVISFRHFYWQNININRTIYVVHSSNSIFKITSDVSIVIYVTEACMLHAQISYSSVLFKVFSLICLRAFAIHHQHYIYICMCVHGQNRSLECSSKNQSAIDLSLTKASECKKEIPDGQ